MSPTPGEPQADRLRSSEQGPGDAGACVELHVTVWRLERGDLGREVSPSQGPSCCTLSAAAAAHLGNTCSHLLTAIWEGIGFPGIHAGSEGGAERKGSPGACL